MESDWIIIVRTQGKSNELELKNALKSLTNQVYKNLSVILTIHSSDEKVISDTLKFIKQFHNKLLIYPIVLREKQGNRSFPLNIALEKAQSLNAKYLSFLDYDDIYYPEMGKDLIEAIRNGDYAFAYGLSVRAEQKIVKDKNGKSFLQTINKSLFDTREFNKVAFLLDNYIPFNSFIINTKYIKEYKYDTRLNFLEDWDFVRRLIIREDFSVIKINKKVSEYRVRNDESDSHSLKTESKWKESRKISDSNIEDLTTNIRIHDLLEIRNFYQAKIERLAKIESNPFFKIAKRIHTFVVRQSHKN